MTDSTNPLNQRFEEILAGRGPKPERAELDACAMIITQGRINSWPTFYKEAKRADALLTGVEVIHDQRGRPMPPTDALRHVCNQLGYDPAIAKNIANGYQVHDRGGALQQRMAEQDERDTHDWRSGGHDSRRGGRGASAAVAARNAEDAWRGDPIPGEDIETWREPQPADGDQIQEQADRFSAEAGKGAKVRYESENLTDDWRREELEHAYDEIPPHE